MGVSTIFIVLIISGPPTQLEPYLDQHVAVMKAALPARYLKNTLHVALLSLYPEVTVIFGPGIRSYTNDDTKIDIAKADIVWRGASTSPDEAQADVDVRFSLQKYRPISLSADVITSRPSFRPPPPIRLLSPCKCHIVQQ